MQKNKNMAEFRKFHEFKAVFNCIIRVTRDRYDVPM